MLVLRLVLSFWFRTYDRSGVPDSLADWTLYKLVLLADLNGAFDVTDPSKWKVDLDGLASPESREWRGSVCRLVFSARASTQQLGV